MLYILLTIIAIGVLLASQDGQKFLVWLIKVALWAGGAYLAFWIVVFVIGLLSDKDTRDSVFSILGAIMLVAYAIYGLYLLQKKYEKGELSIKIITAKIKELLIEAWRDHKIVTIFLIVAFIIITYSFIFLG